MKRVEVYREKPPTALQRSAELREQLAPHMPKVLQNLIDAALRPGNPDLMACKLLVERYAPVPRAPAENPGLRLDATRSLADQARQVTEAIAGGADLDAASAAVNALQASVKISEATELAERIEALERGATPRVRATATSMQPANGVDELC
jgi:hypothetical protein